MGAAKAIAGAALLAASVLGTAPHASASYDQYAINGTYSVVSNGEWAMMNDRYQDEPSVRSTWTVTTTCSTAMTCALLSTSLPFHGTLVAQPRVPTQAGKPGSFYEEAAGAHQRPSARHRDQSRAR